MQAPAGAGDAEQAVLRRGRGAIAATAARTAVCCAAANPTLTIARTGDPRGGVHRRAAEDGLEPDRLRRTLRPGSGPIGAFTHQRVRGRALGGPLETRTVPSDHDGPSAGPPASETVHGGDPPHAPPCLAAARA